MAAVQEYLDAYDRQLRTDAETPGAVAVAPFGPLRLVTFAGGRGFVTYRDLGGADSAAISRWVEGAPDLVTPPASVPPVAEDGEDKEERQAYSAFSPLGPRSIGKGEDGQPQNNKNRSEREQRTEPVAFKGILVSVGVDHRLLLLGYDAIGATARNLEWPTGLNPFAHMRRQARLSQGAGMSLEPRTLLDARRFRSLDSD